MLKPRNSFGARDGPGRRSPSAWAGADGRLEQGPRIERDERHKREVTFIQQAPNSGRISCLGPGHDGPTKGRPTNPVSRAYAASTRGEPLGGGLVSPGSIQAQLIWSGLSRCRLDQLESHREECHRLTVGRSSRPASDRAPGHRMGPDRSPIIPSRRPFRPVRQGKSRLRVGLARLRGQHPLRGGQYRADRELDQPAERWAIGASRAANRARPTRVEGRAIRPHRPSGRQPSVAASLTNR